MKSWKKLLSAQRMKLWKMRISALLLVAMVMSMLCVSAFAAGESGSSTTSASVISAFTTGFQQMASDALSMIGAIVPIALGVAGVIFLAKKAMGWFKSLAK